MSPQARMSSGRSCRGRAAGHGTTPFERALRQVYNRGRGKSNAEVTWVRNPRNGARVGRLVRENGVMIFERQAVERLHKLHNRDAWALETGLLSHVEHLGATWYRIVTDTGRTLCCPLSLFHEHGETVSYGSVQLALPERYFTNEVGVRHDSPTPAPSQPEQPQSVPVQGCLFGGKQWPET